MNRETFINWHNIKDNPNDLPTDYSKSYLVAISTVIGELYKVVPFHPNLVQLSKRDFSSCDGAGFYDVSNEGLYYKVNAKAWSEITHTKEVQHGEFNH